MNNNFRVSISSRMRGVFDGSGAAVLFMHAGGKKENIHWVAAGRVEDAIEENDFIMKHTDIPALFVDVAPTTEECAAKLSARSNFVVIDHHKTAEKFAGLPGFVISVGNKACGTEMFRQWLIGLSMEKFSQSCYTRFAWLIDDHDRWILKQPMSIEMPRLFAFIGQKKFVEWFYDVEKRFASHKDSYWYPEEKNLLDVLSESQQMRFEYLIKNKFKKFDSCDGDRTRTISVACIISAEVNCSELLHMYLTEHPQTDIAMQINLDIGKVSVRSNDRVDLSKFAKLFGGGGHTNSAGYPIPKRIYDNIISGIHDKDGFE